MATLRVFTGVPLPPDAQKRLSGPCAALRRGYPGLRVVPPENLHVTLLFFGELPEARVAAIAELLEPSKLPFGRLRTVVGGLGQFPPRGEPRVLYCPLGAGGERLADLYAGLRLLLQPLLGDGLPQDEGRPFTPHVTVARNKGGGIHMSAAGRLFDFHFPVELDRLVLFQSVFGSQGAPRGVEYRPLKSLMFTEGGNGARG